MSICGRGGLTLFLLFCMCYLCLYNNNNCFTMSYKHKRQCNFDFWIKKTCILTFLTTNMSYKITYYRVRISEKKECSYDKSSNSICSITETHCTKAGVSLNIKHILKRFPFLYNSIFGLSPKTFYAKVTSSGNNCEAEESLSQTK